MTHFGFTYTSIVTESHTKNYSLPTCSIVVGSFRCSHALRGLECEAGDCCWSWKRAVVAPRAHFWGSKLAEVRSKVICAFLEVGSVFV